MKFYLTFGQRHPLRDGFVVVNAPDEPTARAAAFEVLGPYWAFMYEQQPRAEFHPDGAIGLPIEAGEL